MTANLHGKVAMITGGNVKVGKVISMELARAGADVVITYWQTAQEAAETKAEIESMGRKCLMLEADMQDLSRLQEVVDTTDKEFGRLDILVHNASNFNMQPFDDFTEETWNTSFDIIAKGALFLSRAASKVMMKHEFGRIIAICGNMFYQHTPEFITHQLAKTTLGYMMYSLALEFTPYIQCNALCPYYIFPSEIGNKETATKSGGLEDKLGGLNDYDGKLFHVGSPERVAEVVLFLATCNPYLNGAVIPLDGGYGLTKWR